MPASRSTSAIPTALGSAARTRTPTGCRPVLPEGDRPERARRGRSRGGGHRPQRATPQDAGLANSGRSTGRGPPISADKQCCDDRLNPPRSSGPTGATRSTATAPAVKSRACGPPGEDDDVQVLWWRGTSWATPGDFGPLIMPLHEALNFVATEDFFWIGA